MTNADRIRALSDEGLAETLFLLISNWPCPPKKSFNEEFCGEEKLTCTECWLNWLKQEITE